MSLLNYILLAVAYLLGSIPASIWIGKLFYKIDIRHYGSGNAGANNTFRVLGANAGIPVLIIDVLKGFGAVKLILFNQYFVRGTTHYDIFMLCLGVLAVIGHIFPLFAKFNGGKGVATMLGITLALQLYPALAALFIFLIVVFISKYVSLGSIFAGISFPLVLIIIFHVSSIPFIIYSLSVAFIVILTHFQNIVRLVKGDEAKIHLNGRQKDSHSY